MNANVQINDQSEIVTYYKNGKIRLNLDCIVSPNKMLQIGMLFLKAEGSFTDIVKLLEVSNTSEKVDLKIKEMRSGYIHQISTRINPDKVNFVWHLVNFEYVLGAIEDRVIAKILERELEF